MFKKIRFFSIFILLALVLGTSPAGQQSLTTFFEIEFVRGKGKPVTETQSFTVEFYEDPFILHLENGDEDGENRVSSAYIWLNNELLFGPSDFSQQVTGFEREINLGEENSLDVCLEGKPGGTIKIWIEGAWVEPPELDVMLDMDASSGEIFVPAEVGSIEAIGSDGSLSTLTVDTTALKGEEEPIFTLTPISDISNLPLDNFVAGVQLGPDDVELVHPAVLTIELPGPLPQGQLYGFRYSGPGNNFRLYPIEVRGNTVIFQITHFSGYGLGTSGSCGFVRNPITSDDFRNNVSCFAARGDTKRANETLEAWYDTIVNTEISEALGGHDTEQAAEAINNFLDWSTPIYIAEGCLLPITIGVGQRNYNGELQIHSLLSQLIDYYELDCSNATDCDKLTSANNLLQFQQWIDLLGWPELDDLIFTTEDICGGFLTEDISDEVHVHPESAVVSVGNYIDLTAYITDCVGEPFYYSGALDWHSENPGIASVTVTDDGIRVTGEAEGTTTIYATAPDTGVTGQATVEVTAAPGLPEVWIEKPIDEKIRIRNFGGTYVVNIYERGEDGLFHLSVYKDFPVKFDFLASTMPAWWYNPYYNQEPKICCSSSGSRFENYMAEERTGIIVVKLTAFRDDPNIYGCNPYYEAGPIFSTIGLITVYDYEYAYCVLHSDDGLDINFHDFTVGFGGFMQDWLRYNSVSGWTQSILLDYPWPHTIPGHTPWLQIINHSNLERHITVLLVNNLTFSDGSQSKSITFSAESGRSWETIVTER